MACYNDNVQLGLEIPLVSPAYRYAKTVLKDIESGIKGVTDIPGALNKGITKTTGAIPVVLIVLALGIGSYFLFAGKKGVKLLP